MKKSVSLSTRLAVWTGLLMLLLLCLMEVLLFFLIPAEPPAWLTARVAPALLKTILMIAVAAVMTIWALLLWLITRRMCRPVADTGAVSDKSRKSELKEDSPDEREKRLHYDKKMFLHLISVLQTEGRLLDFLNEDLGRYEDEQIGAAVRGVHERCNQVLARYVGLQPVSGRKEGEKTTVPAGFDPGIYRLSGNVTGEPPFEGKIVHKGWRAGRLNIPGFAFSGDPEIIAPMEVRLE